jgi:hypothetical protein
MLDTARMANAAHDQPSHSVFMRVLGAMYILAALPGQMHHI